MTERLEHGGDAAEAEALFGRPQDGWLDLSTGINPFHYPLKTLELKHLLHLPDSGLFEDLRRAAADCYGVSDPALVVPAPGTQALIQWLPRLRARSRVTVLGPTYNEHAHAWRLAGHAVQEKAVREGGALDGLKELSGVVVCVNPNNPDGRILKADELVDLAARLARRDGLLVVDEAFSDVAPEISVAAKAGGPGLVALRSFGKFFGLAGVRLGFALTGPELAGPLTHALGPWAVSGPAAAVGARALSDKKWISETRERLKREAARLAGLLKDNAMEEVGGTDLFRLVESPKGPDIYARLAKRGILVRKFSERPNWLRFGLPGDEDDWRLLEQALQE